MKKSVKRKIERLLKKDETMKQQLVVKLNQLTTCYKALEEAKERHYKNNISTITKDVINSLYIQQCHNDDLVKKICKLVDVLIALDIDFNNELATLIYNHYKNN